MKTQIKALVDKANQAHAAWLDIKGAKERSVREEDALWKEYGVLKEAIVKGTATSLDDFRALLRRLEALDDRRVSWSVIQEAAMAYINARDAALKSFISSMSEEYQLIYVDPFERPEVSGPPT